MQIYNLTGWPAELYQVELGVVDLPDNNAKYISNLLKFTKLPNQIELAACARLIAEFCVANLPKGARVLIDKPSFLMHWLEVELCAEGFLPCYLFLKPRDIVGSEIAGIVEVVE
jgi:hypothetical protein